MARPAAAAGVLPACPLCKQTDQIQKVTATYGANTEEWTTYSDGHERNHEAHTALGLKLQPPEKPGGPTHPGLWWGIGAVVVIIVVSTVCPMCFMPLAFLAPLGDAVTHLPEISGVPNWVAPLVVVGGGTLCLVVIGGGGLVWLGVSLKRRFDRDMANYRSKLAAYNQEALPRWQRAQNRWEQLYYCMRDDTVFIPAENRAIHAADMEKYLYDPSFRG